jgi:hypothetical protein
MKLTKYHKEAIVRAISADIKRPPVTLEQLHAAIVKGMSPGIKRVYAKTPQALKVQHCYPKEYGHQGTYNYTFIVGDADMAAALKPFKDVEDKRKRALQDLTAAVEACSTRKMFIDRFPEFSKYAPAEHTVCSTLPAISNVVASLVEVGWVQTISKGEV